MPKKFYLRSWRTEVLQDSGAHSAQALHELPQQKKARRPSRPLKNFPLGFQALGLHCGIGKKITKPDLAIFNSCEPCQAAGVFTKNQVKAAPVILSQERLRKGRAIAVIINSGCANACTGAQGHKDAVKTAELVSQNLRIHPNDVLVASTGVIGAFLPMDKMARGVQDICAGIMDGQNDPLQAVKAMMTTDTVPKFEAVKVISPKGVYHIWGCVKGAGMIHPNMATMISVILTDAFLPAQALKRALKNAADESFNCASVDGDTSTNDSVYLLANGASGTHLTTPADQKKFEGNLKELSLKLVRRMIADGEGATKTVEITVVGGRTPADAKKIAETVATSPLVKTAMFGNDANWGRIMAAIGRSGVKIAPEKISIAFADMKVAKDGRGLPFSEKRGLEILKKKVVPVTINLGQGKAVARAFTCDFSLDYVKINADYRT